jgi:hypothetical protein
VAPFACRRRRLTEHHYRAGHAERPFELESRKIRRDEAWRGLEPPVFEIAAPPYPNSVTADFRRASREQAFAAWREISNTGAAT